ncbi:cell division protein ZapB [Mitsuaria sp. GD03876]|uniref:cell division protein ZapB n=1 Tax=Mitsuaria sp. GD03876 TaxID=2975399 RepID=UPI00244C71BE|nr:cell division protein ZapB [Mitsuaria sp. GD03876]MDH0866550.1 cell division protein ZapB [Mitsuaria sp. GD03876]
MSSINDLVDRVERLLVRHEELKRTNTLLEQQVQALTLERDSLRSRLSAARARVDALLERLPLEAADLLSGDDGADTPDTRKPGA